MLGEQTEYTETDKLCAGGRFDYIEDKHRQKLLYHYRVLCKRVAVLSKHVTQFII
jgi:hypothetical protein